MCATHFTPRWQTHDLCPYALPIWLEKLVCKEQTSFAHTQDKLQGHEPWQT